MDRDLLGVRRRHSPLASSSRFKSARSVSSREILERICIRNLLGETHQIWVVRREAIMTGKPSSDSNTTLLLSHCSAVPKCLPAPTPGNIDPFVKQFSQSFSSIY